MPEQKQVHKSLYFRVSPSLKEWFVQEADKNSGGKQRRLFMDMCLKAGYVPAPGDF
jgi:hypothetical protein